MTELGKGASLPDLLDSLSLYNPELLDVFMQSLQECQALPQNVGLLAGGTSKAARDATITGVSIVVGAAGVYFGNKYVSRPSALLHRRIKRIEQELADNMREQAKDIQGNLLRNASDQIPAEHWRSYNSSDVDKRETLLKLENKTAEEIDTLLLREARGILKGQLAIRYAIHPGAPTMLTTLED